MQGSRERMLNAGARPDTMLGGGARDSLENRWSKMTSGCAQGGVGQDLVFRCVTRIPGTIWGTGLPRRPDGTPLPASSICGDGRLMPWPAEAQLDSPTVVTLTANMMEALLKLAMKGQG
jgi:hypothetical protein